MFEEDISLLSHFSRKKEKEKELQKDQDFTEKFCRVLSLSNSLFFPKRIPLPKSVESPHLLHWFFLENSEVSVVVVIQRTRRVLVVSLENSHWFVVRKEGFPHRRRSARVGNLLPLNTSQKHANCFFFSFFFLCIFFFFKTSLMAQGDHLLLLRIRFLQR